MKNVKIKHIFVTFSVMLTLLFVACSNDDEGTAAGAPVSGAPPTIESVSLAIPDSLTTTGYANNLYIVRGTGFASAKKLYFNDFDTYFNPTLVTDTSILVTVSVDTPYENVSSELKIVTDNGTAVYGFVIAPPAPEMRGFSPVNAADGETITIKGNFFLDPMVTIGGVAANVLSNTLTEIEVEVPAGSQYKFINVTTISGSVMSTVGVRTAIFDDAFDPYYDMIGFSADKIVDDPDAPQGDKIIKLDVGAWAGVETTANWWPSVAIPVADYVGYGMWIKASIPTDGLAFMLADWNTDNLLSVSTEWEYIVIPFTNYTEDVSLMKRLQWVNRSGDPITYYIDNLGFVPN